MPPHTHSPPTHLKRSHSHATNTLETLQLFRVCRCPCAQIAEVCSETSRGRAFGIIQFALNSGQILSALLATPMSEIMVAGTVQGWRVSFAIVGALSLLLCAALFLFMHEPSRAAPPRASDGGVRGTLARVASEGAKMLAYLRIPTFVVLVVQVRWHHGIVACRRAPNSSGVLPHCPGLSFLVSFGLLLAFASSCSYMHMYV